MNEGYTNIIKKKLFTIFATVTFIKNFFIINAKELRFLGILPFRALFMNRYPIIPLLQNLFTNPLKILKLTHMFFSYYRVILYS